MRTASRVGAVLLSAMATFALLLGLAAVGLGRPERVAVYVGVALACALVAGWLMRGEMRRRRAEEAMLPAEVRPPRRVPRRPITFPLGETAITFALWYAVAVGIDRVVTGTTTVFLLAAVAPFAAFILTALTVAGRHMAFRLTAEEDDDARTRI